MCQSLKPRLYRGRPAPFFVRRFLSDLVNTDLETLAHACYSGLRPEAARSAREYRC